MTDLLDRLHRKENEIARLTNVLLRIARESECAHARVLARRAVMPRPVLGEDYDHYANEDHMGQGG